MKAIPMHDNVLIKPENDEEQMSRGGIIIPDTAKEKSNRGVVIAVGEGKFYDTRTLIPMRLGVGDKIMYSKYGGVEVEIDDEEYVLLSEADVIAVLID